MTEAEWLGGTDPGALLQSLRGKRGLTRKRRLFAVGCCRHLGFLLGGEASRHAVEVAERYADGLASDDEREAARRAHEQARAHTTEAPAGSAVAPGVVAAYYTVRETLAHPFGFREEYVWRNATRGGDPAWVCALVRCVFGNPFRRVRVRPGWLAWDGGVVRKLAEGIYQERAFERLPVLGDALEEAGCTESAILDHCRQPGKHVRGCWVVDALLRKK
jgi:hypothetical protein